MADKLKVRITKTVLDAVRQGFSEIPNTEILDVPMDNPRQSVSEVLIKVSSTTNGAPRYFHVKVSEKW